MRANIVLIDNLDQAKKEMFKIGSCGKAIDIMAPKAINVCIKIYDIGSWEANIIKQEMLSKGGEVAVHKNVCRFAIERSDILIMGNIAQYKRLIQKLLVQPGELKNIAAELNQIILNLETPKSTHIACGTHLVSIENKTAHIYIKPISHLQTNTDDIEEIGFDIVQIECMHCDDPNQENVLPKLIQSLKSRYKKPVAIKTNELQLVKSAIHNGIDCVNAIDVDLPSSLLKDIAQYNLGIIIKCAHNASETNTTIDKRFMEIKQTVENIHSHGIKKECMIIYPFDDVTDTFAFHISTLMNLQRFQELGIPILYHTNFEVIKHIGIKYKLSAGDAELTCNTLAVRHGANLIENSHMKSPSLHLLDEWIHQLEC